MSRLADLAIANYMNQYVGANPIGRSATTPVSRTASTTPDGRVVLTPSGVPAPDPNAPPTSGTNPPPNTSAPPPTTTGGGGSDLSTFGNPTGVAGTGYAGYRYTGFDFNQDPTNRDVGKSAKYAFADATNKMGQAGVTAEQWGTKAGAQEVAIKYIVPEMEARGFKVLEVRGEKIRIVTVEDYNKGNTKGTWVDWVVNADGASMGLTPEIGWQPETAPDSTDPATSWTPTGTTTTTGDKDKTSTTTTPPSTGAPDITPPTSTASSFVDDELMRGRSLADLVY